MVRAQFVKGSRFLWSGQVYVVEEELAEDMILLHNLTFGGAVRLLRSELERDWASAKVRFAKTGKNTAPSSGNEGVREYNVPDLSALSSAQRDEAIRRYALILPLLRLQPYERTNQRLQDYIRSLQTPQWSDRPGLGVCASAIIESIKVILPESGSSPIDGSQPSADGVDHAEDADNTRVTLPPYTGDYIGSGQSPVLGMESGKSNGRGRRKKGSKSGEAISVRSLRRWLKAWHESGGDIRALVAASDKQGGGGKSRLAQEVEECILGVLEWCRTHPANPKRTVEDIYDLVHERLAADNQYRTPANRLKMPSLVTLYRRVLAVGAGDILNRRLSIIEAQAGAGVLPGPRASRPLEIVEYDTTPLDLIVVSDRDHFPLGRPTICVGRCKATGMPQTVSLGFRREGYQLIMDALLYGVLPKPDVRALYGTRNSWPVRGLPETLFTDNGPGFVNRALTDACFWLGINLEQAPRRKAWFKGSIENFIKAHNRSLVHKLPGSVFSSILEKGDYDAIENACITLSTFRRLLHVWLLDIYAQQWHRINAPTSYGLLGGVPANLWAEQTRRGFQPMWHDDAEQVRIWLLTPETRKLTTHGIQFKHLTYQDAELMRLRSCLPSKSVKVAPSDNRDESTEVLFKYDVEDLSHIYVLNPLDRRSWLRVPCTRMDYADGLDMWTHQVLVRYLTLKKRQEVSEDALVEARLSLKQLARQEMQKAPSRQRSRSLERIFSERVLQANDTHSGSRANNGSMSKPEVAIPTGMAQLPFNPDMLQDSPLTLLESRDGNVDAGTSGRQHMLAEWELEARAKDAAQNLDTISTMAIEALGYEITRLSITTSGNVTSLATHGDALALPSSRTCDESNGDGKGRDRSQSSIENGSSPESGRGDNRVEGPRPLVRPREQDSLGNRSSAPKRQRTNSTKSRVQTSGRKSASPTADKQSQRQEAQRTTTPEASTRATDQDNGLISHEDWDALASLGWGGGYSLPQRGVTSEGSSDQE